MARDLTSYRTTTDGATSAASHLLSISKNSASHLAVVRLAAFDKTLTVTPSERRFKWAAARAVENNPSYVPSQAVLADLEALISSVNTQLASETTAWTQGDKAIFSYYARSCDPWTHFLTLGDFYQNISGTNHYFSGHARSVVALKFDFRCLPIPCLTTFRAYVRVYAPSHTYTLDAISNPQINYGYEWNGLHSINGCNQLVVQAFPELPAVANDLFTSYSANQDDPSYATLNFDSSNGTNNGKLFEPTNDFATYDPFFELDGLSAATPEIPVKVYRDEENGAVVSYYHDYELTGSPLEFLKEYAASGAFWLLAGFRGVNGFGAYLSSGWQGFRQYACNSLYCPRIELIIQAASGSKN